MKSFLVYSSSLSQPKNDKLEGKQKYAIMVNENSFSILVVDYVYPSILFEIIRECPHLTIYRTQGSKPTSDQLNQISKLFFKSDQHKI